ncbi:PREDICTED: motile sperm domain-containing protein 2-like [Nicrophorus vespilloides]|uniref:Motile sperm domain-containing protein 2-like n=1 Tax=Nicrophorus vespilloides TaxID=110193 RepID=A0ABM1N021_NICVS|nr:PREDICTED: motile sperm domain-containing protein 2-like [Nicrophorus vespilloides]
MSITQAAIDELRSSFLSNQGKIDSNVHPADLARAKNDDNWLKRFLMHHDGDQQLALNMMWDVMEWRKTFGTNDITESTVKMDYLVDGGFFSRGRDKDGAAIFIFKCKKHTKGSKNSDDLKRLVVYWIERLERQEKGQPITLFFDMEGCGLSNMDMEFTQYLIGLFKLYYPYFLNYIIIFEMAWILNAAFKVIKSLLPEKAVQKIKMLKKADIDSYVPLDQALKCWGGQDDYIYSFESEVINETPPLQHSTTNKKVHFADGSRASTASGDKDADADLRISPTSIINFVLDGGEYSSTLELQNVSNQNLSYKMKTTAPEKFRVKPSVGVLSPGERESVVVAIHPAFQLNGFAKDKFLVMYVPVDKPNMPYQDIVDLWKNSSNTKGAKQHVLRSTLDGPADASKSVTNGQTASSLSQGSGKQQPMEQKLQSDMSALLNGQKQMKKDVNQMQMLLYIIICMLVVVGSMLVYVVKHMNDGNGDQLGAIPDQSQL